MRYQHPPAEMLLQPLDRVITARVADIRQAYRDASGSRAFPDLDTLWRAAVADVRAALDIIDPPAEQPTDTVRVPLLGATRDEQPAPRPDRETYDVWDETAGCWIEHALEPAAPRKQPAPGDGDVPPHVADNIARVIREQAGLPERDPGARCPDCPDGQCLADI